MIWTMLARFWLVMGAGAVCLGVAVATGWYVPENTPGGAWRVFLGVVILLMGLLLVGFALIVLAMQRRLQIDTYKQQLIARSPGLEILRHRRVGIRGVPIDTRKGER